MFHPTPNHTLTQATPAARVITDGLMTHMMAECVNDSCEISQTLKVLTTVPGTPHQSISNEKGIFK